MSVAWWFAARQKMCAARALVVVRLKCIAAVWFGACLLQCRSGCAVTRLSALVTRARGIGIV